MEPETIRALQERVAGALPAERVERLGEWWLRYAPRCSWWAGTVLPHGDAGRDELERRIAVAERFYGPYGTAARFQITPRVCSDALDGLLAERGYRFDSPTSLRAAYTAEVKDRLSGAPLQIQVEDRLTRDWFETWLGVNGESGDVGAEWELLRRVRVPSGYARAFVGGEVVAVGRVVADCGWAGVFGMATLPEARGKGVASSVLASLADWAGAHGADRMYLQVQSGNTPAVGLYERVGFTEVCVYHYRVGPQHQTVSSA
ncbi:GNAT family N-acetyltransferase [Glycomyces sp. L485]|uniref:GNAT family N-acetyltransferase n=1 Tax=Glycomyces sp. L485 TaxID=2909235 RepID=UPI001F4A4B00|nr:GNAT family N-acetyltransferase [Glycomyces sp. L485]MCH7232716.1 GNAT family N-acetyltransferase [Glycomyces sp. L485]